MFQKKQHKEQKMKSGQNSSLIFSAFLALVAAVIIYIVLVQFEKNQLSEYERSTIITASTEITKGTIIDSQNWNQYFSEVEIEKNKIPQEAITQAEQIEDMVALYDIANGTYLMNSMFQKINEIENEYESVKIVSFRADDISQVAGGVLRPGDRVDIYIINNNTNTNTDGKEDIEYEAQLRWENVYIQQAFDGAGVNISPDDTESSSQRFNIYLDKTEVPEFLAALEKGSLRISKCCD